MKITVQSSDTVYVEKYTDGTTAIIGRSPVCDVVVVDESLSRQHCKVELINGDFYITDLNSSNGVYVKEERIPPQEKIPINSFDRVQLGNLELVVNDVDLTKSHFVKAPLQESPLLLDLPSQVTKQHHFGPRKPRPFSRNKSAEATPPVFTSGFVLSLVIFGAVLALAVYKMFIPPEHLTEETTEVEAPKIQVNKKLRPNVFLAPISYNEIKTRSSCKEDLEKCQQLGLDPDAGEGLVYQDNSLFIFSKPERHAEEKIFFPIKENSERDLLISLYYLLRSPAMAPYREGSLEEVHLVFLSADGSLKEAYRFHQYAHSFQNISLSETLQALLKSISTNNSKILWDTLQSPLPKLKLEL